MSRVFYEVYHFPGSEMLFVLEESGSWAEAATSQGHEGTEPGRFCRPEWGSLFRQCPSSVPLILFFPNLHV